MAANVSEIINFSLNSVKKFNQFMSNIFSRFHNKKLTVQTEVQGVEKVEQANQKIESLPKTKTVEMEVKQRGDYSDLSLTGKDLDKTI